MTEPTESQPLPEADTSAAEEPKLDTSKAARPSKKAAKKPAKPSAETEDPSTHEGEQPVKFGRVPGGGPLVPRSDGSGPAEGQAPKVRDDFETEGRNDRNGDDEDGNNKKRRRRRRRGGRRDEDCDDQDARPAPKLDGPKMDCNGMLEIAPKGFGFLRVQEKDYEQARDDVFVPPETIRKLNLRVGQWIHGLYQEGSRGPQLVEVKTINDQSVEEAMKLPHFEELKAINPDKRISFETTPERYTTRVVDIMAPVGKGQRGLIVSPPRSGKTTLMLHMAEAIREKYEENMHLMVVLVDERPEEVTEFKRALPEAEIYASSNDEHARNHCRLAELAIERAKRLVEAGKDVFLLMDSITRLARAYNNLGGGGGNKGKGRGRGGIGSGGVRIGALEVPRRLFAAARNTRGGGSLTILATALIQTNSKADEAIFQEFKGTGNMELVLDRKIAENYIYPAVDIFKSGTRREELLLPDHMLHKIYLIRRGLSGHRPVEAMERLLFFLKKFPNNPQMLLEIKG